MFCPECGQANAEAARFCTACGHSLQAVQAAPPARQEAIPMALPSTTEEPATELSVPPDNAPASPLTAGNPAQADMPTPLPPTFQAPMPPAVPIAPVAPVAPPILCRVCGVTFYPNRTGCPRCGTPAGMIVNAADPTANSYVPVGAPAMSARTGQSGKPGATANTSGTRAPVPVELQSGWNWGAAFVTYLWAIAHRVWWYVALQTLLSVALIAILAATNPGDQTMNIVSGLCTILYIVIYILYRIYFGVRGNRLAWRCRRFDSINQCIEVQETWKPAGIAFGIIALLVGALLGVLFVLGSIGNMMAGIMK